MEDPTGGNPPGIHALEHLFEQRGHFRIPFAGIASGQNGFQETEGAMGRVRHSLRLDFLQFDPVEPCLVCPCIDLAGEGVFWHRKLPGVETELPAADVGFGQLS